LMALPVSRTADERTNAAMDKFTRACVVVIPSTFIVLSDQ
jgi:hypothetical protein